MTVVRPSEHVQGQDQGQVFPALKVIGEPNRLRILCGLGLECRPVTEIIHATGLGQTNVSFHLRVLREAGFVRAERRGPFVYYCLADADLLRILCDLKDWLVARDSLRSQMRAVNTADRSSAGWRREQGR
jgi:ArsR family transcriptional regulator